MTVLFHIHLVVDVVTLSYLDPQHVRAGVFSQNRTLLRNWLRKVSFTVG